MFLALIPVYNSVLGRSSIRCVLFSPSAAVMCWPFPGASPAASTVGSGWGAEWVKCADICVMTAALISGH